MYNTDNSFRFLSNFTIYKNRLIEHVHWPASFSSYKKFIKNFSQTFVSQLLRFIVSCNLFVSQLFNMNMNMNMNMNVNINMNMNIKLMQ